MSSQPPSPSDSAKIESTAATWLARRDRGLTPTEQDEFLNWLSANPVHREILTRLERAWSSLIF
ncbi:MAG: DUF4880 domain-containing protein [Candidatus Synoicihabitans palmerolidicus]|nr:DUF4880 domain-containing protein [Candidatus Synoicihabitans palmerolidicus]